MSLPPQRPPPPPESEKPSGGPGELRSPAARDAQQESPTDTRTEPRFPEQARGSTRYPSQVGDDGGEESDKNLLESAEGPSGTQVHGQPNPFEPPTETTPPPTRSRDGHMRMPRRPTTVLRPAANPSEIDWIVPVDKPHRKTYGERIQPTIDAAEVEKQKAYNRAIATSYALNIAIGLQVLLGALTTGIAAALQTGKQAQVSTSILGGLSTLVASYLARARGSGEPELSNIRVRELDHFLRDCKAFKLDHAHETNNQQLEVQIYDFRQRLEVILGGPSGEKKMSPPV